MIFRPPLPNDIPTLVALNAEVVDVTSPMDTAKCAGLLALADGTLVAEDQGEVIGFVLAMYQGAGYQNDNFQWFTDRLNNFVYVDRIVIGAAGRGQGLGTQLYDALAQQAMARGALVMAAEMDIEPPNETSLAFHAARGFVALGTRTYDTGKTVSMQVKSLSQLF